MPPLRNGESHCPERSDNAPLVRISPPSDPSKTCVGFAGLIAMTCWSGWIPFGAFRHPLSKYGAYAHHDAGVFCASYDKSVNVRMFFAASGSPAVSE